MSGAFSLCDDSSRWLCPGSWMPHVKEATLRSIHRADVYVEDNLAPDTIVEVAAAAIFLAICAAGFAIDHRLRMHSAYATVAQLEAEMATLRARVGDQTASAGGAARLLPAEEIAPAPPPEITEVEQGAAGVSAEAQP